jgi:catechol 2,3-dioxygenase-like lactoylglutathione lyase family enzyme
MDDARPFYDALLPELGFTGEPPGGDWMVWDADGELPSAAYFAITEDPDHVPNANRIAFWAADRETVDRVAILMRNVGATITSGPKEYPEYSAAYYALFFEDPSGNKLEVVFRTV